LSLVAVLPMAIGGIPSGPDQGQHYQSAALVYESILDGQIYPSLAGEGTGGPGYYVLRFYPPLSFYTLALARLVIGDWYVAQLLVFFLAFAAGACGIYLWVRESEPGQAPMAAAIYIFAPYHLNQIYGSFLLAEFLAMVILPFCFYFVWRVVRFENWVDALGLAVSFALLILTHLPSTIIATIAMAIYGVLILTREGYANRLVKLISAAVTSLALTAFYWVRMLPELEWVNHTLPRYFSGDFGYEQNFLLAPLHFADPLNEPRSLWFADLMALSLLLAAAPGIYFVFRDRAARTRERVAAVAVLAVAVFLTTPLSSFLWSNIGVLQRVQFPWRWLSIVTCFGALLASYGFMRVQASTRERGGSIAAYVLASGTLLLVIVSVFAVRGAVYLSRSDVETMISKAPTADGCECWWPRWSKQGALADKAQVIAGEREVQVLDWTPAEKNFTVGPGETTDIEVSAWYYPRWKATANGVPSMVTSTNNGRISIKIPPSGQSVRLYFEESTGTRVAQVVSIVCWMAAILLILLNYSVRRRSRLLYPGD
jgi:hypothetical protein